MSTRSLTRSRRRRSPPLRPPVQQQTQATEHVTPHSAVPGAPLSSSTMLSLQRTHGNRAVQRIVATRSRRIQRKIRGSKQWKDDTTVSSYLIFSADRDSLLKEIDLALAVYHAATTIPQRVSALDKLHVKIKAWLTLKDLIADTTDTKRRPSVESLRDEVLAEFQTINAQLEGAVATAKTGWQSKWNDNTKAVRLAALDAVLSAITSWETNSRYIPADPGKADEMKKLKEEMTAERTAQQNILRGTPKNLTDPSGTATMAHHLPALVEGRTAFNLPESKPAPGPLGKLFGEVVRQLPLKNNLYIGGTPTSDDIKQYGIGDCYFLAALISIVERDPSLIKRNFFLNGDLFQGNFFRVDSATNTWQPQRVEIDQKLGYQLNNAGNASYLKGTHLRVADTPAKVEFKDEVINGENKRVRYEYYETGMWAPLVEKAYALFAQQYGQYGGYVAGNESDPGAAGKSGYELIEGGVHAYVYAMFYGPKMTAAPTFTDISYGNAKEANKNVAANAALIRQLMTAQTGATPANRAVHLTARAGYDDHFNRALTVLKAALAERGLGLSKSQRGRLWRLHNWLQAWSTEVSENKKNKLKDKIVKLSGQLASKDHFSRIEKLRAPDANKLLKDLTELLLDIKEVGTDSSTGQRFIYSSHAYAVLEAAFKNTLGDALDVNAGNVNAMLNQIDAEKSTVKMRNPHHTNEPDPNATGPADGKDDGVFSLTLDQFMRNFGQLQAAIVTK